MFKIKKDKISELKNFGYRKYESTFETFANGYLIKDVSSKSFIAILPKTGEIQKWQCATRSCYFTMFDKEGKVQRKDIIDLIKADMIEKEK